MGDPTDQIIIYKRINAYPQVRKACNLRQSNLNATYSCTEEKNCKTELIA